MRFAVTATGATAFRTCYDHIVPFGETLAYREPECASRALTAGRRRHKGDAPWGRGIWLGRSETSTEHIVGTVRLEAAFWRRPCGG